MINIDRILHGRRWKTGLSNPRASGVRGGWKTVFFFSNLRTSGGGSEHSEVSDPLLARGLDKPVFHPHPCKMLCLAFTIKNVPVMGVNVKIAGNVAMC